MSCKVEECKRMAKRIKSEIPYLSYCERLDVAAVRMGFKHYIDLFKKTTL